MFYSIVIPVYNAQDYIENAIGSIRCQSFQDYEVICVDDGSCDRSAMILDRLHEEDKRIKVVHISNGGVSRARNIGVSIAQGQYLLFMDADDEYVKDALEILSKKLKKSNPDFFCFGYNELTYKSNQSIQSVHRNYKKMRYNKEQIKKNGLDIISNPMFGAVWSKAYKLALIKDNDIKMNEALYVGEDYCFNLEVVKYVENFQTIEDALYNYKIQNNNSIIKKYKKDKFNQMYLMHQIRSDFIEDYLKEKEEKKRAFVRYNFIRLCVSCFMDYSRKECTLTWREQINDLKGKIAVEKEQFCREYMQYYSMPQKIIYSLFSIQNSFLIWLVSKGCYILKFKLGKEV